MQEYEFWKWVAGLFAAAFGSQGIILWQLITSIRSRPTFEQVVEMIEARMTHTPYHEDKRWLTEEIARLKKDVETVDRHVQNLTPKVEEVHLWVKLQREERRARLQKEAEDR